MLRNMMMFTSAMAFALPLALSQPADARPLATPTQPAEWCWGDCDGDKEDDGDDDVSIDIDLKWCVKWEFDERANVETCEVLTGPQCLARCTPDAVAASCELTLADGASPRSLAACGAAQIDLCREQCDSGGAGFCELRGKNPQGIGKGHCKHKGKPDVPGHKHDGKKCKDDGKGDHDGDNDNDVVFVDIDICIDLDIDIDIDKG